MLTCSLLYDLLISFYSIIYTLCDGVSLAQSDTISLNVTSMQSRVDEQTFPGFRHTWKQLWPILFYNT